MATVPVLVFNDVPFGGNISTIILDSSIDQQWTVHLAGTSAQGNRVNITHAVIDNTGNNASVNVSYGATQYSVAPYTRKTFPVLAAQIVMAFRVSLNTVPITFTDFDPGIPEDTNNVASSASATVSTTGAASGTTGGSSGSVSTSLDTTRTDANYITLSQSNLKASRILYNAVDWMSTPGNVAKSASKQYCEVTVNNSSWGCFGLAIQAYNWARTDSVFPGIDGTYNGIVWYYNSNAGIVLHGTTVALSGIRPNDGDVIRMATDLTANKLWMGKVGSYWNGDSNADPATGVGGVDISLLTAGAKVPFLTLGRYIGNNATINFGNSVYAGSAPSGYGNWV